MTRMRLFRQIKYAKAILAFVLGVAAPILLLYQAHQAIGGLDAQFSSTGQMERIDAAMPAATKAFKSPNDYALFSLALIEANNFQGLVNKQRMKAAVMHVGFAIACVGLLFVIFGVDQGGVEAGGTASGISVNIKTVSSGVGVFVLGSLLAGAGGLIPNHYGTAGIPGYAGIETSTPQVVKLQKAAVQLCLEHTKDDENLTNCIHNIGGK